MRSNTSSATHCVAIKGAGIAGSAAAYFARAVFGSDLSVVVFEQSAQIGGRIQHRPFAGSIVETGATLMHSSNQMFTELGLYQLCKEPSREFFAREGIAGRFVREFIDGISRNNYGQNSGIHAFVNLISLAGAGFAGGHLFSILGGNSQVCERLLKRANADIRTGARVLKIAIDTSNPMQYSITTSGGSASGFDAIIIATPLELASIQFEGAVAEDLPDSGRSYQVTHATFVAGDLNAEFFDAQSTNDLPGTILTTENPGLWFSSVGKIGTSSTTRQPIYKVFSREALTDAQIAELFAKPSEVERIVWRAYPVLKPSQHWPPFRLARRIYYANAMESAVSTMETEAVAGRNVVGLLRQVFS